MKRSADIGETARTRLRELVASHGLDALAADRMETVLDLIATAPAAPTAVTDPGEAVDVHLADSLSALPLIDELRAARIADVGSGAGFPGVPLAIARPGVEVDLVESGARKCAFLEAVVAAAGLERTRVVHDRVEDWGRAEGRAAYDAVLLRAIGTMPLLLEYAAPLLRGAGVLIAWKTNREPVPGTPAAAAVLGMAEDRVVPVQPYPASRSRYLHVYRRVGPVPDAYPRRPGAARKRPLGG